MQTIYIIYFIDSDGSKYLEATTNNLKEWLKNHNANRIKDGEEVESLENFKIEKTYLTKY